MLRYSLRQERPLRRQPAATKAGSSAACGKPTASPFHRQPSHPGDESARHAAAHSRFSPYPAASLRFRIRSHPCLDFDTHIGCSFSLYVFEQHFPGRFGLFHKFVFFIPFITKTKKTKPTLKEIGKIIFKPIQADLTGLPPHESFLLYLQMKLR